MKISINHYDARRWPHSKNCTDATASDARAELHLLVNYFDDAWKLEWLATTPLGLTWELTVIIDRSHWWRHITMYRMLHRGTALKKRAEPWKWNETAPDASSRRKYWLTQIMDQHSIEEHTTALLLPFQTQWRTKSIEHLVMHTTTLLCNGLCHQMQQPMTKFWMQLRSTFLSTTERQQVCNATKA